MPHRETIVMARGKAYISRPGALDSLHPGIGVEVGRVETFGSLGIFVGLGAVVEIPLPWPNML